MPYQYIGGGSFSCGPDIASAVTLSLEDRYTSTYTDYYENCDYYNEMEEWKKKSVKSWNGNDIVHWLSYVARDLNVCPTDMMAEKFSILDGFHLSCFSIDEFISKDPTYGEYLYKQLQIIIDSEGLALNPSIYRNYCPPLKIEEYCKTEEPVLTKLEVTTKSKPLSPPPLPPMARCPVTIEPTITSSPTPGKKGRGRPRLPRRKKKTEKLGRLWEFLRDLLKNPAYCPSLIVWENHDEGMFRFVHSDKVAKLWGSKKENPDMNYEKLSRAMRYYYKSKVLLPVYGRRLVYKFGPTAKDWRVENPNFSK